MAKNDMDHVELIEKALLVQNLKSLGAAAPQMSDAVLRDKLIIHFQKKSNHGGDIRKVLFPLNSLKEDAIVIFADAKDMLSAAQHEHMFRLQHEHVVRSHRLRVRRLPPVFTVVEAKIDPLYFNIMPLDASTEFSERIENLANVKVDKAKAGKISCSHPSQLKIVEREICGLVMNRAADSVWSEDDGFEAAGASNFGFESSPVQRGLEEHWYREDDEMEVANEHEDRKTTGSLSKQSDEPEGFLGDHSTPRMQRSSSRLEHDDKPEEKQISSLSALNDVALQETDVENVMRFQTVDNLVVLDKSTYEYLVKFEDAAFRKLLKRSKVQMQIAPGHDNSLDGFIFPSANKTPAENVSKAKEEFITFYQKIHFDIARKTIDCSSADVASIGKATDETLRQFKTDTLITEVDGSPHLRLILRRGDVEEVARQFRKIAGIKSGKTLRNTGAGVHGTEATSTNITKSTSFGNDNPKVRSSASQQNMQSSQNLPQKSGSLNDDKDFTTNEGIHIVIRTGDITKHSADAVISPSDNQLLNEGGVAKAIVDAAGPESRRFNSDLMKTRHYKKLQTAECVITQGFKLKCKAVIHVCGPTNPYQQQFLSHLYMTFLSCLRTAEQYSFASLAIPLIGSGSIAAPKKDCADALAQALIDFSREPKGSKFVREVFLVNIDENSSKAIQQSFHAAFSAQHHAASSYKSSNGTSGMGFPQSAIGDASRPGVASNIQSMDGSATPGRLSDEQSIPGGSRAPVKTDHQSTGKAAGSQNHWPKRGDPQGHVRKDQHGIGTQLRSQNLTTDEWPLPGKSEERDKKTEKGSPDINARDNEEYGNRRASHDANLADKSVGSSGDAKARAQSADDKTEDCAICLADKMTDPVKLKCKHQFCKACIEKAFKNDYKCPVCQTVCRPPKGNQPMGTMTETFSTYIHLSGYENSGVITIRYQIPGGTQSANHPDPGQYFTGVTRTAYLPDNPEGREVLGLLRKAFDAGLVFTVGRSVTSGVENIVTWNDIHHKTSRTGGPQNYGYPDPGYLKRVKEDLAAKGIQ